MRSVGRVALCLLACASPLLAAACGEPRGACDPSQPLVCGFENPEDVALVPRANLVVSSQPSLAGLTGGRVLADRAFAASTVRSGSVPAAVFPIAGAQQS